MIKIDKNQVLNFLGYKDRTPNEKILNMINEEIENSYCYFTPRFYNKTLKIINKDLEEIILEDEYIINDKDICSEFLNCEFISFNIVTIGDKIEKLIKLYMDNKKAMKSLINDKISVVALDYVVDKNRRKIINALNEKNLTITTEIFPGDKDCKIENLSLIFSVFKEKNLDIKLNDYFMMEPVKSTAFIWGIGKGIPIKCGHCCSRCKNPCNLKGKW